MSSRSSLLIAVSVVLMSSSLLLVPSFATGTLTKIVFYPSTDIVNSVSYYTITFKTATTSTLTTVNIVFSSGFGVSTAFLSSEKGLPAGTISTSGTTITYTLKTATSVLSGTTVTMNFYGIKNTGTPSSSTTATVSTFDSGTLVDTGTSAGFVIRQLTGSDISSSSSLVIAALSTGTLSETGPAVFGNTVTTTGLLTANGGISVPTGNVCVGSGSTSCGGAVELDSSGAFSAGGNKFAIASDGNVLTQGNVTAENFITQGQLYVASGTFHVNGVGQIASQSVGFVSFDSNSLPSYYATSQTSSVATGSYNPGRNAEALVFVTVDVENTNGVASDITSQLLSSYSGSFSILPESTHAFYLAANAESSVTYEYTVTGITSGSGSGTFTSNIYGCSVGPACTTSLPSSDIIYDNFVQVVWLPE